jgi:alkylation response protein AidB-like acyl-CoA dehydrogenase
MPELASLTDTLRSHAQHYEDSGAWPQVSLDAYRAHGGWRWGVASEFGGLGLSPPERLSRYVAIARGDMSAALYITQHDGAVDLIYQSANQAMSAKWLPRFARGEALTTIGYSQLTTSRQGGAPAMRVAADGDGFVFDGVMPWVTGAPHVTNVACGGTLDNGEQLLALVDLSSAGISIVPAAQLVALNSTHTCEVHCSGVRVSAADVIAGPEPQVLRARSALRLLLVSATGIGLGLAMLDYIREDAASAAQVDSAAAEACGFEARLAELAGQADPAQADIDALRAELSAWLVRLAGMTMVRAKGSGFKRGSLAQRLSNEALFFCVWSASTAVRDGMLTALQPANG